MSGSGSPARSSAARPAALVDRLVGMGRAVFCGVGLGRVRLWRRPLVLVAVFSVGLGLTAGLIERAAQATAAVDRALDAVFRLVVPLVSFVLVSMATGRRRLGDSVWCAARFGLARRELALGLLLAAAAASAALALVTVHVTIVAAGPGTSGLGSELWTSGWIAVLSGCAYAAWFGFGATWLRFGRGRWMVLFADFTLGTGAGLWAAVWPRPHVRSLVGGLAPLDLPQATSSVLLLTMALALGLVACIRCGH